MKKLVLDDIQVDSYPTTARGPVERGTVDAQMATATCPTWRVTCPTTLESCYPPCP